MKNYEDVDSWKTIMFLYNSALKEVGTKLEILNDEFQHVHKYNPIEHIKTRLRDINREYGKIYQWYRRGPPDLFLYIRYLPAGGDDR